MGCRVEDLLRDPRALVPAPAAARFAGLLRRRLAHEPMALLRGEQGFWSLNFQVSPATLIPRADSEALVEAALAAFPNAAAPLRVLDLGTGTGCLLLAVLAERPEASGLGVDRVPAAAALARENARMLGLAGRARFLVADWAAPLAGQFDLVLCNPPYIESAAIPGLMPEVARHEPASALDGGADGLAAYRAVLAALPGLLAPGGLAVLELGAGQESAVSALAVARGLALRGCRPDLGGVVRALMLAAGPA
jgi:release factor glutamine methyltransferase